VQPDIGELRIRELVPLGRAQGVVRSLWRHRNQGGPEGPQAGQELLVGAKFEVAIRAPLATVEGEHDRPLFDERMQLDGATLRVR
jgi:hypothetical protein